MQRTRNSKPGEGFFNRVETAALKGEKKLEDFNLFSSNKKETGSYSYIKSKYNEKDLAPNTMLLIAVFVDLDLASTLFDETDPKKNPDLKDLMSRFYYSKNFKGRKTLPSVTELLNIVTDESVLYFLLFGTWQYVELKQNSFWLRVEEKMNRDGIKTWKEFAAKAGIKETTLCTLRRHCLFPNVTDLSKIAFTLNKTIDEILFF